MATPQEKLNEKIKTLKTFEAVEALDFIEYLEQKRTREIKDTLENAPEVDEPLTEEEIQAIKQTDEDVKKGETLSFDEVFGKYEKI